MGKFFIECPRCGGVNQASTSIFSKKIITCTCGNEIDIKASRGVSKICPACSTVFVCDLAKMKDKRCPKCGEPVTAFTATAEYKMVTLTCPQCSCRVEVDKTKPLAVCPICDEQFDVQKEIAKDNAVKSGGISTIKYEGDNSTFIWKHPIEDFNFGSQLIVHENQLAIFLLGGEALDTFGPGRHTLQTENIPHLNKVYNNVTNNVNPFHAEVYFVNLSEQMDLKWGTPDRINIREAESDMYISIGASGSMGLSVDRDNARKLLTKFVGTTAGIDWGGEKTGFAKSIKSSFRGILVREIKSSLASVIKQNNFSIFEIDMRLNELSEALSNQIKPIFAEYGLIVKNFSVESIALPEDDPEFVKWKKDYNIRATRIREEKARADIAEAEQRRRMIEAETAAKERVMAATGDAEITRLQGFAEADVMRAKGYTEKDLIDAEVQKAYAAGMGQFGANAGSGGGGGATSEMMNMMMGMKMFESMSNKMDGAFSAFGGGNKAPAREPAAAPEQAGWTCSCGNANIQGKFCPECGSPKPAPAELWNCECGARDIKGKFCPECGKPKPVIETWDCACGTKGIKGKFCPECGSPKPETWDCTCGTKGIKGKFCPECGKPKG